jgi:hypothetical protein
MRRSIDWKLVNSLFDPLHARIDFTLEGCADDEGLNPHKDLSYCSPSDSILKRDLRGERVLANPLWELSGQIAQHVENCTRIAPTYMMVVFDLPKWAKFNGLSRPY